MASQRASHIIVWTASCIISLFAVSVFLPINRTATLVPNTIPANGISSARLNWSARNVYGKPIPIYPWDVRVSLFSGGDKVKLIGDSHKTGWKADFEVALRALHHSGEVVILLWEGASVSRYNLLLQEADGDMDSDGIPDKVELKDPADREAFRSWFTAIAESQFFVRDSRWAEIHQDCAGLIRFCYREALREHDERWFLKTAYLHHATWSDVHQYHYPHVPILGERVFRVASGAYSPLCDVQKTFSSSASAQVLWEYNTVLVSKDPNLAKAGDLLFFRDPEQTGSPMHSMILLDSNGESEQRRVVYHTGGDGEDAPDEVRMVTISDLNRHKDDRWRVRADNPYFLGFHRWKILEGGRL